MADFRLGSMVAEVVGEGPDVVMVHGLGGTSNSFTPLMPALDGFRVIRPDLPGAGRSAYQPGRATIAALLGSLVEMLDAIGVRSAALVGHSMGTLICQQFAVAHPDRVRQLFLFGAILEPLAAARAGLRERAGMARQNGMSAIADAVSAAGLSGATKTTTPAAVAFVRESVLRQDPEGYAAHCRALAEAEASDPGRIVCPVGMLTGEDDQVAPPAMAGEMQRRLPHGSCTILASCGHWPMIERPRESVEGLLAALRKEPAPR